MSGFNKRYYDRPYYDILETEGANALSTLQPSIADQLELDLEIDPRPDVVMHGGRKVRIMPNSTYEDYLAVTLAAINFIETSDEFPQTSAETYKAEMMLRDALREAGFNV